MVLGGTGMCLYCRACSAGFLCVSPLVLSRFGRRDSEEYNADWPRFSFFVSVFSLRVGHGWLFDSVGVLDFIFVLYVRELLS